MQNNAPNNIMNEDAAKEPAIKIYTTPTCIYCHALMDWLDQQNISYQEIDASNMSGIDVVPVTEINGERIIGFDRPAITSELKKLA